MFSCSCAELTVTMEAESFSSSLCVVGALCSHHAFPLPCTWLMDALGTTLWKKECYFIELFLESLMKKKINDCVGKKKFLGSHNMSCLVMQMFPQLLSMKTSTHFHTNFKTRELWLCAFDLAWSCQHACSACTALFNSWLPDSMPTFLTHRPIQQPAKLQRGMTETPASHRIYKISSFRD